MKNLIVATFSLLSLNVFASGNPMYQGSFMPSILSFVFTEQVTSSQSIIIRKEATQLIEDINEYKRTEGGKIGDSLRKQIDLAIQDLKVSENDAVEAIEKKANEIIAATEKKPESDQ